MTKSCLKRLPIMMLVSTFLLLDFTLLFINFNLTKTLSNDAQLINISGYQRMLSQRIAKDLLIITNDINNTDVNYIEDIGIARQRFDTTLSTFVEGGELETPTGEVVQSKKCNSSEIQNHLEEAQQIWKPINDLILNLEQTGNRPNPVEVNEFAHSSSDRLLELMDRVTYSIQAQSQRTSLQLRIVQILIFLAVLANFFAILYRLDTANKDNVQAQKQLENLIQYLSEVIFLVDAQQRILFANRAATELLAQAETKLSKTYIQQWLPDVFSESEITYDQKTFSVHTAIVATIPSQIRMVGLTDITEQVNLKVQTTTDPLTGLPNRNGLNDGYQNFCHVGKALSVLFLDLDRFKPINDQYGHRVGDKVLHIIAQRFGSCLKSTDVIARVGGDEFVIIIDKPARSEDIVELQQRIERTITQPIYVDHIECLVGISIGVSHGTCGTSNLEDLIQEADAAMYDAKREKKRNSL